MRVMCLAGDMHSIPTNAMDISLFKLVIGAPKDRPNHLTIGPIFTQPSPFAEIRDLHIVNSNVPSIGEHAFWGLKNLRILDLSYNSITSIGCENFKGLVNLIELNLSYNHINNMPSETFQYCTSLKTLNLSYNHISILMPRVFRMLGKLNILDLSGNHLKELEPDVFKDIQTLSTLKCRDCFLSRINTQIYHLAPKLTEIDLGYNQIKYLLADEFQNLKHLTHLKLDGNQISVIVDNVFAQNRKLKTLNLANNRLALLSPMSLTNLTSLEQFDISYNKIDRFHLQTFAPVVKILRSIDFSGNNMPLNEVAVLLQMLPGIENVGLANLSLPDIPPNFFMYNKKVLALDLSWNKFSKFPVDLLSKTKLLHTFNISHNHLTALEEPDLKRLEAISDIDLSDNIWHCDQCSTGMMLVYMKTTVLNESLRNLRCTTPMTLRGTMLADLNFPTLDECLPPSSQEAQISLVAGLVLVLVAALAAVMATLCCTRRRVQRYYTNEEKRVERDHEHPEELLPHTELGTLSTIHVPCQGPGDNT